MKTEKRLFKCQAFSWVYGERIVHKEKYRYAMSEKQALILAFMNDTLRDGWSICATEVKPS